MKPKQREIHEANELYAVLGGTLNLADCKYLGREPHKRRQTEAQAQIQLIQWAHLMEKQYPELALLFHVPNGGYRNGIEAARLKQQGVKAGVPDLCLPVACGGYHALFIELKAPDGRVQDTQKWWVEHLTAQGYRATVCFGFDEARAEIEQYLGMNGRR